MSNHPKSVFFKSPITSDFSVTLYFASLWVGNMKSWTFCIEPDQQFQTYWLPTFTFWGKNGRDQYLNPYFQLPVDQNRKHYTCVFVIWCSQHTRLQYWLK